MMLTLSEIYCREKLSKVSPKEPDGDSFDVTNKKFEFDSYTADEDGDYGGVKVSKGQELHYILGVVLEPDVIDGTTTEKTMGDIYNEDEVRKAAHHFMLNYKGQGNDFMHDGADNPDAFQIVESYIAPAGMQLGGEEIKKGTWMMATLVFNEQIWKAVKEGRITGYSIGGYSNARIESS